MNISFKKDTVKVGGSFSDRLYQLPGNIAENVHVALLLHFQMQEEDSGIDWAQVEKLARVLKLLEKLLHKSCSSVAFDLLTGNLSAKEIVNEHGLAMDLPVAESYIDYMWPALKLIYAEQQALKGRQ